MIRIQNIHSTFLKAFFLLYFTTGFQVQAQLQFDENFENGVLDTVYLDSGDYNVWPITNLHFRITNAINENPTFKIFDSVGYQLRSYHYMVYRYGGESTWNFFDTAFKATSIDFYHFQNTNAFIKDTVYVAYWYPYTYSDLQAYMQKIQGSNYLLDAGPKSTSYQGRELFGYQITDTNYAACYKQNVVITARQHPTENINGYFIEGLTNYLLYSTDSIVEPLRRNFHFFIYPMLNPDGVFNGSGQNALGQGLNREWEDSLTFSGTPEIDSIRPVIWNETNQRVDWSIDIHSNPGSNIPYYWWGYNATSPMVSASQIFKAGQYVQAISLYDSSSTIGSSLFQNYIQGNGVNTSKTAANWFRKTFNAIAFTFEPTSEPMGPLGNNALTIHNLKLAGASLVKGFYDMQDTATSLGGHIISLSNQLIAIAEGGYPPYSFNWSGPVSANTDTLYNPPSGIYTLSITDSLGCSWHKSITFQFTGNAEFLNPSENLIIFPNPTSGEITLIIKNFSGTAILELFDLLGKIVFQKQIELPASEVLVLPNNLKGTYLLKLTGNAFVFNKSIVILK